MTYQTFQPAQRALLVLLSFLLAASAVQAQPPKLGVSPTKFFLHLDKSPKDHSFRVFNYDDEDLDVQLEIYNWDLDENNKTRILPPTEQSLDQWIVINPVRFTIPAKGSRVVRFSIRPRVQPEPGEHRAIIYLASVPPANKKLSVRFNLRLGMAVYGWVGDVTQVGTLNAVEVKSTSAVFDITSEGNAHVRLTGQYAIWPTDRYPGRENTTPIKDVDKADTAIPKPILQAGLLPARPVLAGDRRKIPLNFAQSVPPGEYILDLNGDLGDTVIDMAVHFTVAEPVSANR